MSESRIIKHDAINKIKIRMSELKDKNKMKPLSLIANEINERLETLKKTVYSNQGIPEPKKPEKSKKPKLRTKKPKQPKKPEGDERWKLVIAY